MRTKKEIVIQAKAYAESIGNEDGTTAYDYVMGYTQCQENMANYIFQVAFQFHRLGKYYGNKSDTHFTDIYEETINSLNKQD
jgi:hypothetical protein